MTDIDHCRTNDIDQEKANRDRTRLIDHFKRLYTIIVGLAITDACHKLLPFDPVTFSPSSFWMFCAFFITIVPIFQGGDRSLDLKYLDEKQPRWIPFVWDVFMLIMTAMFFVAIADSIPSLDKVTQAPQRIMFFYIMGFFFLFDVFVLVIDYIKNFCAKELSAYIPWAIMNIILCAVCFFAAKIYDWYPGYSLSRISSVVFICAAIRSIFDYKLSGRFMFPQK